MKKYIFAAVLGLLASQKAFAATDVIEVYISTFSAPVAVTVSSQAYTNVTPASVRITNLSAILIDSPATNTARMHGHIGNCASTSISTSTVRGPIEIAPDSNGGLILIGPEQCLWLNSRADNVTEPVYVQGVGQKR